MIALVEKGMGKLVLIVAGISLLAGQVCPAPGGETGSLGILYLGGVGGDEVAETTIENEDKKVLHPSKGRLTWMQDILSRFSDLMRKLPDQEQFGKRSPSMVIGGSWG